MTRRRTIAVLGGRAGNAGQAALDLAEAIGAEIGRRGYGLISGGDAGVAEAANRGCQAAGGETLALLKWNRLDDAGPSVTWSVPTSMDLARSNILNWAGDGILAFEGRFGTMSEIGLALDTGRPMLLLGRHPLLNLDAVPLPSCRLIENPTVEDAASLLELLESLMEAGEPPPVRPAAALFPIGTATAGGLELRRGAPDDREMFRAAFSDPDVLAWWHLEPTDAVLQQFQHERCLTVVDRHRAVGFLEYRAETDPDFEHISLRIVIANAADRGRSIGTRALTMFARAAFDAGHHRLAVRAGPDNTAAVRCCTKVGFRTVGRMRSSERYRDGWRDALLMELIEADLDDPLT